MKIAVVTGASSGLGREFTRQITKLYKSLDEIWVVARRTERLKELAQELALPVRIFDGDMNRDYIYERIERALEKEDADIRMLVNAAGYGKVGRFSDIDEEDQLGMIDLNCRALTRMISICRPYFNIGTRVINIASAAAFSPQPGFAVYAATKAYVYSLSYALAAELENYGVRVTAVCPGPVDTEFFDHFGEFAGEGKKLGKAPVEGVVRQALLDAAKGRSVSVYGASMKTARVLAKIIPAKQVAAVMKRVNRV